MSEMIGDRLKKLRKEKGMTQEEVGSLIGASKQTLYKYENNIVTNIPADKIEKLAALYGVTPAHLMGWREDGYYHDPEVAAIANEMKDNPDIKVLFDATRGLSKKSIEEVKNFIIYQKAKERGEIE